MPRFARLVEKYRSKAASVRYLRSFWFLCALRISALMMTVHQPVRRIVVHTVHLMSGSYAETRRRRETQEQFYRFRAVFRH